MSDLDNRLKAVGENSAALKDQTQRLAALDKTLGDISRRLGDLEEKLNAPKTETRAPETRDALLARDTQLSAAQTVIAQALVTAINNGAPFKAEVAALRGLGAEEQALSRLDAAAASDVPTLARLREEFAALRAKLAGRDAPADANASWIDRIKARLSSLVTIRSADERAGPSPEAVASRIDAALARGDVAGALDQYKQLPPAEQDAAKGWAEKAAQRVRAEADARALLSTALASLARPRS